MQIYNDELYHYGKIGMKWGKRGTYGRMPIMLTKDRQIKADKKALNGINNKNHHTSFGLTKKRQAAFDERDKRILEKRITKNESNINSSTPRLKFKKHKAAKITATALTQLGLMTATSAILGKKTSLGTGTRYASSLLVGGLGANKVANILQDN